MNKKSISKQLDKLYWKNKQRMYIRPIEVLDSNSSYLSIYAIDPSKKEFEEFEIFLFDVRTYTSYIEDQSYYKFDSVRASCALYYNLKENTYTLRKFSSITKSDILECFRHFKNKVIDQWCLFNFEYYDIIEKGKEYQYEFDFCNG